jgi:hypothetical protein
MVKFVRAATLSIFICSSFASSVGATTYEYAGNPLDVVLPCCSTAPAFTGSVTFDFNTFGFTGTVYLSSGHVTDLPFGDGLDTYRQYGNFVLLNGSITNWALQAFDYGTSSFGDFGDYYSQYRGGSGPYSIAFNQTPGVWTPIDLIAPVPNPIVGAGLPGLLMAIAGFIGWRRSRRSIAT